MRYKKKPLIIGKSSGYFLDGECVIVANERELTVKQITIKTQAELKEFAEALSEAWKTFLAHAETKESEKQVPLTIS